MCEKKGEKGVDINAAEEAVSQTCAADTCMYDACFCHCLAAGKLVSLFGQYIHSQQHTPTLPPAEDCMDMQGLSHCQISIRHAHTVIQAKAQR